MNQDFYKLFNDFVEGEKENKMNVSITENGAIGYKTTKHALLDMNFKISSYRNATAQEIVKDFKEAYKESPELALKWLFYARDVLEGAGERYLFRQIVVYLATEKLFPEHLIQYIPQYGRFDDWFVLVGTPLEEKMFDLLRQQITADILAAKQGKPYSLLAKWMPSINTSSESTRILARKCAREIGVNEKQYRKMLSKLRAGLDVVERKMTANAWSEINYEHVPSKANLIYRDAFNRHDVQRRTVYLGKVAAGEAKMQAKTLMPHEIVHQYSNGYTVKAADATLELAWANLPTKIATDASTIVVADGSGSMTSFVGNTKVTALAVAQSLAIYFAERLSEPYKNKYITFSANPQYVDLTRKQSLHDKIAEAYKHCEVADTNIEKTFDLLLQTAVRNNLTQAELPAQVLIISDMEFNEARGAGSYWGSKNNVSSENALFETIKKRWARYGYTMPKLVFWNVMSRTNTIPLTQNESGLILLSGFSPNSMKMVMTGELDPYKALVATITSKRYEPITLRK